MHCRVQCRTHAARSKVGSMQPASGAARKLTQAGELGAGKDWRTGGFRTKLFLLLVLGDKYNFCISIVYFSTPCLDIGQDVA